MNQMDVCIRALYMLRKDKDFIAIVPFGSMVYGTNNIKSDHDYIIIMKDLFSWNGEEVALSEKFNLHFYSESLFKNKLNMQDIAILECLWSSNHPYIENIKNTYQLHKAWLRESVSAKSSNSWVKAKKKIEKEQDFYVGKKSLWHSLRILMFGIQIAKYGKIINYGEANYLYDDIVNNPINNWKYFNGTYKKLYNSLSTEFRKVAPK